MKRTLNELYQVWRYHLKSTSKISDLNNERNKLSAQLTGDDLITFRKWTDEDIKQLSCNTKSIKTL